MKKLYSTIVLLGIAAIGYAQCTISNASVTPTGLTVNATMTAAGAAFPGYGWDWGDATTPSTSQTATHTYAAAGTYTVCAIYVDITNTTCIDTLCQMVTVSAVGIVETVGANTISVTPNPFNTTTSFNVNLTASSDVEITVYDVMGQKVETIRDEQMNAGKHEIAWTPANLAAGVYFVQMTIDGKVTTKRIVHSSN
jgi:PKD repeat protein